MNQAPRLPSTFKLVVLDRVGSTNNKARDLAEAGAVAGTVVWAKTQTAGRGRYGRQWASPPGNLYLSILLRPNCTPQVAPQIGFAAAVALGRTLEALASPSAPLDRLRYKWPNDVLIDGRKICGILLESATSGGTHLDWLVVGVGVNIVSHPDGTDTPAGHLHEEGFDGIADWEVLSRFAEEFDRLVRSWQADGFGEVRHAWLERALGYGEEVKVNLGKEQLCGRFVDLEGDGVMVLEDSAGVRHRVNFGDVRTAGPDVER